MPEIKNVFTSGRMNKDLDERQIPNGEYRDALNIQIANSEGSDIGAVENLLGNIQVSNLPLTNPKVIGAISYTLKDKIYWFVTSDHLDGIYEFDANQYVTSPILIDRKETLSATFNQCTVRSNADNEFILDSVSAADIKKVFGKAPEKTFEEVLVKTNVDLSSAKPSISISIPKGTIIRLENKQYVFKNIEYNGKNFGNVELKADYTTKGSFNPGKDAILNFSRNNLITGISIVDGLLFWTDNINPPRCINIAKFKKYSSVSVTQGSAYTRETKIAYEIKKPNTPVETLYRDLRESDINVAKKAPLRAPNVSLSESLIDNERVSIDANLNFYQSSTLSQQTNNDDNSEISSIAKPGDDIVLKGFDKFPFWKEGDIVNIADSTETYKYTATVKSLETVTKNGQDTKQAILTLLTKESEETPEDQEYTVTATLKEGPSIFEKTFVRFAYRWKYSDGQYSTISPFSDPCFIHDKFLYDGNEAYNFAMLNKTRKITLTDPNPYTGLTNTNESWIGDDTVAEIEILFKEARNQNIYSLESKKRIDFPNSIIITKKQIHSVLENEQLLRQWDNVPKKAKALEVTSNRIIYGNYTQNYDVYNEPSIRAGLKKRKGNTGRTIKSNRTYQIGVVYMDEYNVHTPVQSNQSGTVKVPMEEGVQQNQFKVRLAHQPPAWATHFKYYIKDTSAEYYNLACDKIYEDNENGFAYISFPSSERNKITEETYLVLKKKHGNNEPVTEVTNNRFKIIDIFNEPPDFVAEKKRRIIELSNIAFNSSFGATTTQKSKLGGSTPIEGSAVINIRSANSFSGVSISDDDKAEIKPGRFIKFTSGKRKSKAYEISTVKFGSGNMAEITVKKPFENDVNIVYDADEDVRGTDSTDANDHDSDISIDILEKYQDKGAKAFDGRFFIKVRNNSVLTNNIIKSEEDPTLFAKRVFPTHTQKYDNNIRLDDPSRDPAMPVVIIRPHKGSLVPELEQGKNWHIVFQSSTADGVVKARARELFKKFDKIQFLIKGNGSDVKSDIYTIGDIYFRRGPSKGNKFVENIFLHLTDEEGEEKELQYELFDLPESNIGGRLNEEEVGPIEVRVLAELEDSEDIFIENPAIFETEPIDNPTELNIYYETNVAFPISQHGSTQNLSWFNAFSFGNGVESNRIRDDFNAVYIGSGVRASSTISQQIREEHKFNGLIWSGIINSRSGLNASNQFNVANPITKDLLPSYGAIQKLYAWANRLTIFCEDKVLNALSDKDQLFNADGSSNIVASNNVIGSVNEYAGDFGISDVPESFAVYGFRVYFADRMRGVMLRLSADGLTVISQNLMSDFFRDRFFEKKCFHEEDQKQYFIGSFDEYNKLYNISFEGKDTVSFSENSNGWVTRKSFVPEWAVSLNNKYYTFNNGNIWLHDSTDVARNNFYNTQYNSSIEFEMNASPSVIKSFKTLSYEGTKDWKASMETDQQKSSELEFTDKENKFFAFIKGEEQTYKNIDLKNFSVQGIGTPATVSSLSNGSNTTITFELDPPEGVYYTSVSKNITQLPGKKLENPVEIKISPKKGWELDAAKFKIKNVVAVKDGDDIIIRYTHEEKTQPTENKTVKISLCYVNFASQKIVNKTGTITIVTPPGITVKGGNTIEYDVSGEDGEIKTIGEITLIADEEHDIDEVKTEVGNVNIKEEQDSSEDNTKESEDTPTNTDVGIDEIKDGQTEAEQNEQNGTTAGDGDRNDDGTKETKIELEVELGQDDEEEQNETINITSTERDASKKLIRAQIPANQLSLEEEKRFFVVNGDPGAVFSYTVYDGTSNIVEERDLVIDSTKQYFKQITFPAGTSSKTYTITTFAGNDTVFTENFLKTPITIERIGVSKINTNFKVILDYSGGVVTKEQTFVHNTGTSNTVDFSFTLDNLTTGLDWIQTPSFSIPSSSKFYKNGEQIAQSAIGNRTFFLSNFNKLTVDSVNGSITIKGRMLVSLITANSHYDLDIILDLNKIINQSRQVTFEYNTTTTGGTLTTGYAVTSPSDTTVSGREGGTPQGTELQTSYRFILTPNSGQEFIDDIDNDDFILVDASNNEVFDIYSNTDELNVTKSKEKIIIDLLPKNFIFTSDAIKTISIRPIKQIAQAEAVQAKFNLTARKKEGHEFNTFYGGTLRLGPMESETDQEYVYIYDVKLNEDENFRTIPANYKYIIPTTGNTDANLTNFNPSGFGAVTATGAATLYDETSVTIATGDGIVPSEDKKSAKIQVKGNLYSSLSQTEGFFDFIINLEESYSIKTIQRIVTKNDGTQVLEDVVVRVYNKDYDENEIVKGSYLTDEDGNPLSSGNGTLVKDDDVKIKDELIRLTLESNGSIDRVHDLEVYEKDTDGDGIPDELDNDRDGDGVLNPDDLFPDDPNENSDFDGDGIGDNSDTDIDGDGVSNEDDAFDYDADEDTDSDGDGVGNNADTDDDNDGVLDTEDAFETDASESVDTDGDGTGDNADTDDDGDGVLDADDAFPLDATETTDTDGDGIGDNTDTDIDGDGVANEDDYDPYDADISENFYFRLNNIDNVDLSNIDGSGKNIKFRIETNIRHTDLKRASGYALVPHIHKDEVEYRNFDPYGGTNGILKVINANNFGIEINNLSWLSTGKEGAYVYRGVAVDPNTPENQAAAFVGNGLQEDLNGTEFSITIPRNTTGTTNNYSLKFGLGGIIVGTPLAENNNNIFNDITLNFTQDFYDFRDGSQTPSDGSAYDDSGLIDIIDPNNLEIRLEGTLQFRNGNLKNGGSRVNAGIQRGNTGIISQLYWDEKVDSTLDPAWTGYLQNIVYGLSGQLDAVNGQWYNADRGFIIFVEQGTRSGTYYQYNVNLDSTAQVRYVQQSTPGGIYPIPYNNWFFEFRNFDNAKRGLSELYRYEYSDPGIISNSNEQFKRVFLKIQ